MIWESILWVVSSLLFVGAVVAIQMFNNFDASSFPIPPSFVGYATKAVLVLEFAPTIISLILAGKVGSYIASSIGTMRVSEQIDALDIMGVNSPNFLIFPKIIACVIFNPFYCHQYCFWYRRRIYCRDFNRKLDRKRLYCWYSNVYA
jgi:ABC-type transporter Mla maintaining outer membrane lipid asymmetry permease subunit MlaE